MLVAWVVTVLAGLGSVWFFVLLVGARRHRAFVGRCYAFMRLTVGGTPVYFSRVVLPLTLLAITVCLFGTVVLPLAYVDRDLTWLPRDAQGVIALSLLALAVLLAGGVLVVPRLGRPRFLILEPCRALSEAEVAAWLLPPSPRVVHA